MLFVQKVSLPMKWCRLKWREDGTYLSGYTASDARWTSFKEEALVLPKDAAFTLAKTWGHDGLKVIAIVAAPDFRE